MRIIHTSDLHLESSMTKLSPEKAKERRLELIDTFERMVKNASAVGAEVFIIAGDMFDNERYTKRAAERVAGIISNHPEITFLYLIGNHEAKSFIDRVRMPQNLLVFGEDWTYYNIGEVTFAGRSSMPSDMFSTLSLDESRRNILVLHGEVKGSMGESEGISLTAAKGHGIDYIALGHYHRHEVYEIDRRGVAVYSGTPEGRGFDEVGECGFVMLTVDAMGISYNFCPFAKREIEIIEIPLDNMNSESDVYAAVDNELSKIPLSGIVRVKLVGKRNPEVYPSLESIKMKHKDRYYHFEVEDESRTKINPDDYRYSKSVMGEFIRLVYSKDELSDEDKEAIIRCGLAAMNGDRSGI